MTNEGAGSGSGSDDGTDSEDETPTGEPSVGVALENRLMSHGIYVTSFAWMDGTKQPGDDGAGFELEYEVVSDAPAITSDEVGAVLRALLSIGDERAWTPGRLEATSTTTDGAIRGWWYVEREWFERLGSDLSQLEFSQRVLDTVTHHRSEYTGN